MPELRFSVEGARAALEAALPTVELALTVQNPDRSERVHGALVRCQVLIDAPRRNYTSEEADRLLDVFGPRSEWHRTLQRLAWTTQPLLCPEFEDCTLLPLPIPVPLDPDGPAGKYLWALEEDPLPLLVIFSGTVFHAMPGREVSASRIPWGTEVRHTLSLAPVDALREARGSRNRLELGDAAFARLHAFRRRQALPGWDETVSRLLDLAEPVSGSFRKGETA